MLKKKECAINQKVCAEKSQTNKARKKKKRKITKENHTKFHAAKNPSEIVRNVQERRKYICLGV